jgi:hypothetical protein
MRAIRMEDTRIKFLPEVVEKRIESNAALLQGIRAAKEKGPFRGRG